MTSSVEPLVITEEPPHDPQAAIPKEIVGKSPLQIAFLRLRKDKVAIVCFAIIMFFAVIAVFAGPLSSLFGVSTNDPELASHSIDLFTGMPLKGPPLHGFDPSHPFGVAPATGDDNLAYWLQGARTSLFLAVVATIGSTLIGVTFGLLAGFLGGIVDAVISFLTDLFLTIPFLLAALAIGAILADRFGADPDRWRTWTFNSLILILVAFTWMGLARLIRGEVLALREREFVQAARVIGVPTRKILISEILPNLVAPIVVTISLSMPAFVSAEAGLTFLGIGVQGRPSWGQTIASATKYWETYPLYLMEPVLGIIILVVALNLFGDALRDALDPKTRR
jgi:ABC-type dipeptide/oligopeptide/nickel transport system permease subunit